MFNSINRIAVYYSCMHCTFTIVHIKSIYSYSKVMLHTPRWLVCGLVNFFSISMVATLHRIVVTFIGVILPMSYCRCHIPRRRMSYTTSSDVIYHVVGCHIPHRRMSYTTSSDVIYHVACHIPRRRPSYTTSSAVTYYVVGCHIPRRRLSYTTSSDVIYHVGCHIPRRRSSHTTSSDVIYHVGCHIPLSNAQRHYMPYIHNASNRATLLYTLSVALSSIQWTKMNDSSVVINILRCGVHNSVTCANIQQCVYWYNLSVQFHILD
jgi:hypothetical protein